MTYTAVWDVGVYLVTFNANGGENGWSEQLPYGSTITPPTVTRTGHTFTGWEPEVDATVPEGGAEYTAQWRVNQYTVTFDGNGGSGGTSAEQDYGSELNPPTVSREGHTFTGWEPPVDATVPEHNVSYVAQWQINQYTLTFDAAGGTGGTSITQDYGTSLVAPEVSRVGYTFAGWNPEVPLTMPESD